MVSTTKQNQVRVSVDLARCQTYGQCVYFAPDVFRIHGREILEFDGVADESRYSDLRRARAACPVQAIVLGALVAGYSDA